MATAYNDSVIGRVKEWLTPILMVIVGTMLWNQLTELKQDVKLLLINSGANEVRISRLEADVIALQNFRRYDTTTEQPGKAYAKKEEDPEVPVAD